jgi:DNA polymerase (family 10)
MPQSNEDVARLLENIAKLLALTSRGDPFRIRAYTEAARNIAAMDEDIETWYHAGRLDDIPGVGSSIAAKIGEYLETGHSTYYEELKRQTPLQAVDLLEVPGIGPVRARLLVQRLGITSAADLARAAQQHQLRELPGFGAALEERIAREAGRVAERTRRMLLGIALPAAEEVVTQLRTHPAVRELTPAGSIRRMRETIGDIDLLAASDHPAEVLDAFARLPLVKEVLAKGPTRGSILTRSNLQIDLRAVTPDEFGAALQYFTGSKDHNIALRTLAVSRGWKLSEYGLFDARGQRIAGRTEQDIYSALGLEWMPPELRENRGELEAAAEHRLPQLVTINDIRGDLHVHTDWSDGHDTAERMVEAAIARGYQYIAFTDHSRSLRVAHGLSVERVREQRRLIARLNERYAPFRVFHGIEVDILPNGMLDYPDDLLAELDIVCAAVHTAFRQTRQAMTARIGAALANPHVDILGHPTGRILLGRAPYEVDLDVVLRAAAERGVALEIDGQPDRLDLDDMWARRAKETGALLVCDSDAHAVRQLEYMRYAVATARRGWAEPRHILNTLPLDHFTERIARRRLVARAAR